MTNKRKIKRDKGKQTNVNKATKKLTKKATTKGIGRTPGTTDPVVDKRYLQCSKMLARGYEPAEIWQRYKKDWGISLSSVSVYCTQIRARWHHESLSDDAKTKRAEIRKMLFQVISTAYEQTEIVYVGNKQYDEISRPDLSAVNQALRTLCQLEGAYQQVEGGGVHDVKAMITILTNAYGVSHERVEDLAKALHRTRAAARMPKPAKKLSPKVT